MSLPPALEHILCRLQQQYRDFSLRMPCMFLLVQTIYWVIGEVAQWTHTHTHTPNHASTHNHMKTYMHENTQKSHLSNVLLNTHIMNVPPPACCLFYSSRWLCVCVCKCVGFMSSWVQTSPDCSGLNPPSPPKTTCRRHKESGTDDSFWS